MKYLLYTTILIFSLSSLSAQDNWEKPQEGEFKDSRIFVNKNKELELPKVQRSFQSVPAVDNVNDSTIQLSYQWQEIVPQLRFLQPSMRVLRIKSEPLDKLYGNTLSAGFGNYGSTYLSGYLSNKRDRYKNYGIHFYHKAFNSGSIDGKYSGSGYQFISPYGKLIKKGFVLQSNLHYERGNNYAYGLVEQAADYDEQYDRKTFQKLYQSVGVDALVDDRNFEDNIDFSYQFRAHHFFTNEMGKESFFDYKLHHAYNFTNEISAQIPITGFFSKYTHEVIDTSRYLWRVQPSLKYVKDRVSLQAGFNLVGENDFLPNMGKVHFYPVLEAKYAWNQNFNAHVGLKGDVDQVLFQDLVRLNPLIEGQNVINSTLVPFKLYAGVYANLFDRVAVSTNAHIAAVQNLNYFVNRQGINSADTLFTTYVGYFTDNVTELGASMAFTSAISQVINLSGNIEYQQYFNDEIAAFPHVPAFKFGLKSDFTILQKFELGVNLYSQSKTQALFESSDATGISAQEVIDIDPFVDLGLDLKYNITDRASAFVELNNLIAKEYTYYLNYPGRGFQALAGFTYSF